MVSKKENLISIIVEKEAFEGVKKIAERSAKDMELVIGDKPQIFESAFKEQKEAILYATVGKSQMLEDLEKAGKLDLSSIRGKREVYGIFLVKNPNDQLKELLVIAGSDKRGTIYGIFTLSEKFGISPLLFWGDVTISQTGSISFTEEMEECSKEPSVKYRGFFINDEWPCFGNWTFEHFDGFTAKMYDNVFELLLRLKGNYLWSAMWTSSFALDGPGDANAVLADTYGVIIGNSHHEPCLRASEEWDFYKVQNLGYGTQWDYSVNKDGLLKYWRDGLMRSGKYESIVTIGMRGERDSEMQGNHTLAELIDMLKDIITNQENLISQYADTKERRHPRLLAIYKEVETYFYGDETAPGLKEWDGLKDTILMFCEDNFGNMRWLPNEEMRKHQGGFGMYFHLDYHGDPISYEWINSTPLTKIWEQMTQAYEYGVKDVWIVNVGDLKGNEFPLSYFLNLAYDYDKWGVSNLESAEEYTKAFVKQQFYGQIEEPLAKEISDLLTEAFLVLYKRRPESLNSSIYHPAHEKEADRMIIRANDILNRLGDIRSRLSEESLSAFYSIIERPIKAGMNLLLMHLYAGKNEWYANQGKVVANEYGILLTEAMKLEKQYNDEYKHFANGKWSGMELGNHIGFVKWNEDGCKMPLRHMVEPLDQPRMLVSRADEAHVYVKNYGTPETIVIKDFMDVAAKPVTIEIANGGNRKFDLQISKEECDWISLSFTEKEILVMEELVITCIPEKLPKAPQMTAIYLSDGDATVKVEIWGMQHDIKDYPKDTFFEQKGSVSMLAKHYAKKTSVDGFEWKVLKQTGRTESCVKVLPIGKTFEPGMGPSLTYQFVVKEAGQYQLEVLAAASNAADKGGRMLYGICMNQEDVKVIPSLPEDYMAGKPACKDWCEGVLSQIHRNVLTVSVKEGFNTLTISAIDPGFVLEKLILTKNGRPDSYLGPEESTRI